MTETLNDMPLSRYTVLDLTVARAGPTAVRLLADWGANIIRVEPPPPKDRGSVTGRRRAADEQNLHRNKRSVCLDLKHPEGAAILRRMVETADVVVENFRSEVKERLGLDYASLARINPGIVLASISGFGQDGPYSDRPGLDQIVQGMSGLMSVTGDPAGPPTRVGIAISDTASGMFLGQGILLALLHRAHTGQGQWVHTSLLESMLSKLDFQGARYTMSGEVPAREGNFHPTLVPMGTYDSSDGLVNIAASTDRMFQSFCSAVGAADLAGNPDYATPASRLANRHRLNHEINAVTQRFSTDELVARLNPAGVPCGPIYDIRQAFEDAQVQHLRMTCPAPHPVLGDVRLVRSPINLSRFPHPESFHHAGPDYGEHTDELLAELGYDQSRIDQLKHQGAVA
jgi:crotonobetainyl-CoA:carnitine CoA-transferase CaiB-like acyl-CoA transferase